MKRYWYKRILIMVLVFAVSVGGGYYLIQYKQETLNKEVSVNTSGTMVIPGGMPVGIYLETEGVLVLGTDKIKADRKSTRLNSSHSGESRMPSSA